MDSRRGLVVVILIILIASSMGLYLIFNSNQEQNNINHGPELVVENPTPGSTVSGQVSISFEITDEENLNAMIYLDGTYLTSASDSYSLNTTSIPDGKHTLRFEVEDSSGLSVTKAFEIVIDNVESIPMVFDGNLTTMEFNIKESGLNDAWKDVVKEQNPDVLVLVETGYMDDHANESFNAAVSELNGYFVNESEYHGICAQNIRYSTSGEAIITRYPILYFNQIPIVPLDDGTDYDVTHDFIHAIISVNGTEINVIGGHLKASEGADNELRRDLEAEGIINYIDALGDVPILYMSDQNSFSPFDTGNLAPTGGDLGYGPMTMMLDPLNETYGNHSSLVDNFTDVYRFLNPTQPGYTYGHQTVTIRWRIDFIIVNDFFIDKMAAAKVITDDSANVASDHYAVVAVFHW